ncbi:MAG: protein-glutamate O-methyltransferase CheR [Bdellovibrio sp.]
MSSISIERKLLLEGIYLKYGYDFRDYAESSMDRRIEAVLTRFDLPDEAALLAQILRDKDFFYRIIPVMTISTSEMFRDPEFFLSLRTNVIPMLRTYPNLNVWIAGCSTGEEVYSMAILLKEEGLYERSRIYATDINPRSIQIAKEGIYDLGSVRSFTRNYTLAGGLNTPSDYYTADYNRARFRANLRENVIFSEHNLATDAVFMEAHLILCRNVLIYFNRTLQSNVFELFYDSLSPRGFLGLGSKETLRFSHMDRAFEIVDHENKIFRKNPLKKG